MSSSSSAHQAPCGRRHRSSSASPRAIGDAGSSTVKVVPTPSVARARRPSRRGRRRSACTIERPEPDARDRTRSVAVEVRKKRSNSRSRSSAAMPMPVSATSIDRATRRGGRQRTVDAAARGRELDRVGDQVVDHLREPVRVAVERRAAGSVSAHSSTPACSARGAAGLDRVARRPPRGRPARRSRLSVPGLDLGDEQQVADEPQQPPRVALDHVEELPLLVGDLARLLLEQQLEVADDRRQRRAQLVRDEREELVLEPLRLGFGAPALEHLGDELGDRVERVAEARVERARGGAARTRTTRSRSVPRRSGPRRDTGSSRAVEVRVAPLGRAAATAARAGRAPSARPPASAASGRAPPAAAGRRPRPRLPPPAPG